MNKDSTILIVGHDDIMENALYQGLTDAGYSHVHSSTRLGLNATIQAPVYEYFQEHRPEYVFLGSTQSGGIVANQEHPADFIYHNIQSSSNIMYAAHNFGAKKVLYYASSCVYPRECRQPMTEDLILSAPMEPTSLPYSMAKASGLVMAQSFRRQYNLNAIVMIPATVYGPGFDKELKTAHVIGAKIHECVMAVRDNLPDITIWGSGKPRREFLYVDDFVDASLFLMQNYDSADVVNVGVGADVSITELTEQIARIAGFSGEILFDGNKPDGTPQKLLDHYRIKSLGWSPRTTLEQGLKRTIDWYQRKVSS